MFEKRVTPGKTYCVTAYCPIVVSSELNNTEVILVDTTEPGQYFFVAPTTSINSSISPNYILEVKGGGGGSGSGESISGVGITFEKVDSFDSLPETGQLGTIYLVPNDDTENQYTEYVYIDDRYEIIGSKEFTMPDLSGYAILNGNNTFTGETNTFTGNISADNIESLKTINTVDQNVSGTLTVTGDLITDGTGKDFQDIIDEHVSDDMRHVTAEAIQAVMPVAWENNSAVFGVNAKSKKNYSVALGYGTDSQSNLSITIGSKLYSGNSTFDCITEAPQSITIGAGANTLNNGDVESSNSITIGCKASNSGADSVVIGAAVNSTSAGAVTVGAGASATGSLSINVGKSSYVSTCGVAVGASSKSPANSVAIGYGAVSGFKGVVIGRDTNSKDQENSIAIGYGARASAPNAVVLGANASCADAGAVVFRSTAEDGTYTQLYFSGANTPLANTYHDGAPMLGYVTKDSAGNIVAAGTRSLIDLLTDNSTFAPASLDENGEWVQPTVFHPSDLDLPPQEEPTEEEYTPMPVYPIVEPEIPEEI